MPLNPRPILGLAIALFSAFGGQALAGDGVAEINHTCAVQTGCFPGDTPGYPVTIDGSAGSSYRLTSRLVVPDENTSGIAVGTSEASIDLNNFAIVRSGCEGATASCKPSSGSGDGIEIQNGSTARGASVRNGSIVGMGSDGIRLGDDAEIIGLRVRWNRQHGIRVGASSRVSRSSAFENGSLLSYPGIWVGPASTIEDCVVHATAGVGILADNGSTVSGSAARANIGDGIQGEDGSIVVANAASQNSFRGINGGLGATLRENAAYQNSSGGIVASPGAGVLDNAASGNSGDGIETNGGGAVQGNALHANTSYGLNLAAESAYRLNVTSSSGVGTITGGVNLFSNACDGDTSCP